MEEDRYTQEVAYHIEREAKRQREGFVTNDGEEDELDLVNEFKELVAKQKSIDEEKETVQRMIKRKPTNPVANRKNYDEENERMGVRNEVDLILNTMG